MSLFGDIADGISSFFGGGKNVANLAGTALGLIGNDEAANTVAQGNNEALGLIQSAADRARGDVTGAQGQATGALAPFVAAGAPAESYLKGAMATNPALLTPSEKLGLADLTRQTRNNLAVSGLRGAGQAGQAVLADATRRYMAGAYDENQRRADQAAGTLAGQGYGASQGTANIDLGTGSNLASIGIGEGNAAGRLAQGTAGTRASSQLADSQLLSRGLGALASGSGQPAPTQPSTTTAPAPSSGLSVIGQYIDDSQKTQDPYANFKPSGG